MFLNTVGVIKKQTRLGMSLLIMLAGMAQKAELWAAGGKFQGRNYPALSSGLRAGHRQRLIKLFVLGPVLTQDESWLLQADPSWHTENFQETRGMLARAQCGQVSVKAVEWIQRLPVKSKHSPQTFPLRSSHPAFIPTVCGSGWACCLGPAFLVVSFCSLLFSSGTPLQPWWWSGDICT